MSKFTHHGFFSRVTKFHLLHNFWIKVTIKKRKTLKKRTQKKLPFKWSSLLDLSGSYFFPNFFFMIYSLKYMFFYVVIRGLKPPLLLVVRPLKKKTCILPTYYNLRTLSIVEKNTSIMKCNEAFSLEEKKEL